MDVVMLGSSSSTDWLIMEHVQPVPIARFWVKNKARIWANNSDIEIKQEILCRLGWIRPFHWVNEWWCKQIFMGLKVVILQMTGGEGFFRGPKLIVERAGTVHGDWNFLFCPRNLALQKMIRKGTRVQKV